ncbi:MAG: DNA mismatch repair protein MutS [Gemmatimonadetes bacterium]|nr:DNA mismatch repair protein MutS [Gemmatimonadota bacterium]|tara:strand:- start:563 stop:3169 length:2607 start_codon:yes stop_codon:yes gene_type:complete
MEQYLRFKGDHEDAIVLFRMGDFYETFYEDAKEVSRLLGLTLTSRNNGRSAAKVPMAGIPHHALDTYLSRLIKLGRKVAICEQMEPPQKGKAIVRREVTQVVSPGTALSDNLLDQKRNNYLAGLCVLDDLVGVALADLSTGSFRVLEQPSSRLWEVLEHVGPSEVLAPESWVEENGRLFATHLPGVLLGKQEDRQFGLTYATEVLQEHFKVASLKGFGCEDLGAGACAAGAVLNYLQTNQKGAVSHITRLQHERNDGYMDLDLVTQRNLELVTSIQEGQKEGTLISVLDSTCSALGARELRSWLARPLLEISQIVSRQDAVALFLEQQSMRLGVRDVLQNVGDLERMMSRICCGRANPRDMVGLKLSLQAIPGLRACLNGAEGELLANARDRDLRDLSELTTLIDRTLEPDPPVSLADGGVIRAGFHAELDELRHAASGGRSWVAELQARERERTGIPSLKVGYNKAFGYYIEITKANMDRAPEEYIRKQTLVNAERFITPDLKEWEAKILGADERAKELEKELFQTLRLEVEKWVGPVQQTARAVADVDVLSTLAEVAATNDFVRPSVEDGTVIEIKEGRHPVVERLLPTGGFVPNDFRVSGDEEQVLIITGPNMAGKSTILRQVGLIVLLAQVGSFVPATVARVGVVDRIFTRVGASDNLAKGESTFLVEMNEAANILNNATPRSLVLLDEIGRGTSTFDGLSIAWAMTEHLHNAESLRPRTLFATHYHELTELEEMLPRVRNYSVAVRKEGDTVVFLHRLVPGGCDHSYGIEVAQLAGMPPELIARAREVLGILEQNELTLVRDSASLAKEGRQITLFAAQTPIEDPIIGELRDLDIGNTTPLEALSKLDEFKRRIEPGKQSNGR